MPSFVFGASENWVEVIRFVGSSSIYKETESFQCNYADWRINWEYDSNPSNPTVFKIDLLTKNGVTHKIYSVTDNGLQNPTPGTFGKLKNKGICYVTNHQGNFSLYLISTAQSYTINVEQNTDSIPEFPSWAILALFLVASLTIVLTKKVWRQAT